MTFSVLSRAGIALCALALMAPAAALADFELVLTDTNTGDSVDIIAPPNGSTTYTSANSGIATITGTGNSFSVAGTFGNFQSFLLVGAVNNSPGSPLNGNITITSLQAMNTSGSSDTLGVTLSANNFTQPGSAGDQMYLKSELTSLTATTGTATVTYNSYADPGNTLKATTVAAPTLGPYTATTSQSVGDQQSSAVFTRGSTPYSLTSATSLTISGGGQASILANTTAVLPEPGTLAILASGLPMLGFFGLRRRRQAKANVA